MNLYKTFLAGCLLMCCGLGTPVWGKDINAAQPVSTVASRPMPVLSPGAYRGHFWRLDASNESSLPRNFRTCQSPFHPVEAKYATEVDAAYVPSRKGLENLSISGSGQFSSRQFDTLVHTLRKQTKGPIYDIDLRQESHGFFNGTAVSWYGRHDWGNIGKSQENVVRDERQQLQDAFGKTVVLYDQGKNDLPIYPQSMIVRHVQTEQELVESKGIHYVRLASTDHLWPSADEIDAFMAFVRTLPADAWLHFHCEAGAGRTTTYMVLYDMIKNPDVPYRDIVYRQYEIGGNYTPHDVTHPKKSDWKSPYYHEKHEMIQRFYCYVKANYRNGFRQPWSAWISENHTQRI